MKKTEKYLKKLIDEMPEYNGDIHLSMDNEGSGSVKKGGNGFQIKYSFVAACILILLISVPVAAKIPFVTERMQDMPQEEIQDMADMINALDIQADLFSRPFSEEERVRMKSMREEYKNGIFPDEDILIVSGNEQTDVDFYYNRDTGMFILPDSRELTDEELRQYIDFSYKVDYSLQQRAPENHVSEENEKNYDITDWEVPEEHKEFIQACLTVLGINNPELTNLHIEEVYDDANINYSYQTDAKILSFSISPVPLPAALPGGRYIPLPAQSPYTHKSYQYPADLRGPPQSDTASLPQGSPRTSIPGEGREGWTGSISCIFHHRPPDSSWSPDGLRTR